MNVGLFGVWALEIRDSRTILYADRADLVEGGKLTIQEERDTGRS